MPVRTRAQPPVRIRETLLHSLAEGRDIRLAIVITAALGIDGAGVTADLGLTDTRLLIESAALALARRAGEQIQNLSPRSTEAAKNVPSEGIASNTCVATGVPSSIVDVRGPSLLGHRSRGRVGKRTSGKAGPITRLHSPYLEP
jgi:hypothetical protein